MNCYEWTCPSTGNVLRFNTDLIDGMPELARIDVVDSADGLRSCVCVDKAMLLELRAAIDAALEMVKV